MKKIILGALIILASAGAATAQRAAARKAEITKGLKEQVKLSDEQVTAVIAIEEEYHKKQKDNKADSAISETDKKAKTKTLNEEKKSRLEKAVGKENAASVETFYAGLKKADKENGETPKKGKKEKGTATNK